MGRIKLLLALATAAQSQRSVDQAPTLSIRRASEVPAAGGQGIKDFSSMVKATVTAKAQVDWELAGSQDIENDADARIADAERAIIISMKHLFHSFPTNPGEDPTSAASRTPRELKVEDFRKWLRLLGTLFPNAKARKDLKELDETLWKDQWTQGLANRQEWDAALAGITVGRAVYEAGAESKWRHCRTYECGLWMLIHMLTVSAAEAGPEEIKAAAAAMGNKGEPAHLPLHVRDQIRHFVKEFMSCPDETRSCVSIFEKDLDTGHYNRLTEPTDGRAYAIELWKVHNHISSKVSSTDWPSPAECPECWTVATAYEPAIYEHLRHSYLPSADEEGSSILFWLLLAIVVVLMLVALCWRNKKRVSLGGQNPFPTIQLPPKPVEGNVEMTPSSAHEQFPTQVVSPSTAYVADTSDTGTGADTGVVNTPSFLKSNFSPQ